MSDKPPVRVEATREFEEQAERLQDRYPHLDLDIAPIIDLLEQGELPGDKVPGVGYSVYKVRAKNRDARKGKSGGYRIIYYARLETLVVLVTIYSKSDKADIPTKTLQQIIERYEQP